MAHTGGLPPPLPSSRKINKVAYKSCEGLDMEGDLFPGLQKKKKILKGSLESPVADSKSCHCFVQTQVLSPINQVLAQLPHVNFPQ